MAYLTADSIRFIKQHAQSHIFWLNHEHIDWNILARVLEERCMFYQDKKRIDQHADQINQIYYQLLQDLLSAKDISLTTNESIISSINKYIRSRDPNANNPRFQFITWLKENKIKNANIHSMLHVFEEIYLTGKTKKAHTHFVTLFEVNQKILQAIPPNKIKEQILHVLKHNDRQFMSDISAEQLLLNIRASEHRQNKQIITALANSTNNFKFSEESRKRMVPTEKDHQQYIVAWLKANDYKLDALHHINEKSREYVLKTIATLYQEGSIDIKAYNSHELRTFIPDIEKIVSRNPDSWNLFKDQFSILEFPGLAAHLEENTFDHIISSIKQTNIGALDWEFIKNCPPKLRAACFECSNVRSNLLMTLIGLDPALAGTWNNGSINNNLRTQCALTIMELFPEFEEQVKETFIQRKDADALINAILKHATGIENVYTSFKLACELQAINEKQVFQKEHFDLFSVVAQFSKHNNNQAIDLDFEPGFD